MKKLFLITTLLFVLATMPAISFAEPLLNSWPNFGDIKVVGFDDQQGAKALLANDFKLAKKWYSAELNASPFSETAYFGLARANAGLGDYVTAKKYYEIVTGLNGADRNVKIMAEYCVFMCHSGLYNDQQILETCNKVLDICQNERPSMLDIPAQQIISEQGNNSANKTIEAIMHLVLAIDSSVYDQKSVKSELDLATSLEPTSATIASYRAKLLKPTPASGSVTLAIPATPAVASPK